jgi:hypothetical protein
MHFNSMLTVEKKIIYSHITIIHIINTLIQELCMLKKLVVGAAAIGLSIIVTSCSNNSPVNTVEENSSPIHIADLENLERPDLGLGLAKTLNGPPAVFRFWDKPLGVLSGWSSHGTPDNWRIESWYGDKTWYAGYFNGLTVWDAADNYDNHFIVALVVMGPNHMSAIDVCGRIHYSPARFYSVELKSTGLKLWKHYNNTEGSLGFKSCTVSPGCYYLVLKMEGRTITGILYSINDPHTPLCTVIGKDTGNIQIPSGKPGFLSFNAESNKSHAVDIEVVPF